jgi:glycerol-3-phosphate acyltransferase PlsX
MAVSASESICRIAIDAMGGDYAPENIVLGTIKAIPLLENSELFLVGIKEKIQKVLDDFNLSFNQNNIIDAPEIIEMAESPTNALKSKPNSSLVIGAKMVKEKKADAFVSAGNTGAMMAASTLITGRIEGVGRPTIGAQLPNIYGTCSLYDVGAGKDAKPVHLLEYAIMGSIYAKEIDGIENPKVGLLSMGEEEGKGNEVSNEAYDLLKKSNLNFVGNVEGRDLLTKNIDVVVCDGFVGNILLKFGESVPNLLKHLLKQTARKNIFDAIKIYLIKGTLRKALKSLDYQEYGGVPLLGINGIAIIGHGSSTPKAITNMILKAKKMFDNKLVEKIQNAISEYKNKGFI